MPLVNPTTIEQYYLHVPISNLRPGCTYYYTLGHDGWDSRETFGSFTTAPSGRVPFRFTAFGDEGVTYDSVATAQQVRGLRPAFHLHAGDISYAEDGGDGLLTDSYDPRVWDLRRRPRHQRPQPHLRAEQPADRRQPDLDRPDWRHHHPGHPGHHLRGGRRGGREPLQVQRPRQLSGRRRQRRVDLLVVDSAPAGYPGGTSKLLVRGLNEDGQELDNFTLARTSKFF